MQAILFGQQLNHQSLLINNHYNGTNLCNSHFFTINSFYSKSLILISSAIILTNCRVSWKAKLLLIVWQIIKAHGKFLIVRAKILGFCLLIL